MAMETRDVLVSRRTRSRSTGHAESWGDAVAVSAAACNVSWTAESSTSASAAAIPQAAAAAATGGCHVPAGHFTFTALLLRRKFTVLEHLSTG